MKDTLVDIGYALGTLAWYFTVAAVVVAGAVVLAVEAVTLWEVMR